MSRHVVSMLQGSPLLSLPLLALALFGAVFLAVLVRLARQGAAHYDGHARTPLEDELPRRPGRGS
jgi:hypothetical protein